MSKYNISKQQRIDMRPLSLKHDLGKLGKAANKTGQNVSHKEKMIKISEFVTVATAAHAVVWIRPWC